MSEIEMRAAYIEHVNAEREVNNYLLATIGLIRERIKELKQKSNPRSLKFWIRLLFDKQLRNAVRAIIEFDFEYVEATATNNRGKYSQFFDRLQKSSNDETPKVPKVDGGDGRVQSISV